MTSYSRRHFLRLGARTLAGSGLALGSMPLQTLAQMVDSTAATGSDYRALVCIYLDGGCDGFSLVVPTGHYEHEVFAHARGSLAIDRHQLLSLGGGQAPLGLHPAAGALQDLYDDQNLAVVANVGTLIEPTTREQYENQTVTLPAQLFSHSDQSIQWQQLQGPGRAEQGWGALACDFLDGLQDRDYLTAVSLSGANYWQSGAARRAFNLSEDGVIDYHAMDSQSEWQQPRWRAFNQVLNASQSHVFSRAYADLQKRALTATTELGALIDGNRSLFNDVPDENPLASRLAMVAQIIAAHESLALRRQIFYVSMGGYDVHDNQARDLPELFRQLAEAMAYFQGKIRYLGYEQNVTSFTASDFGRALNSNGDGTDHGWGNHLMVMGGAVRGGQHYGTLPQLDVNGPDAVNRGRIIPTLAATQYASTLLQWLGLQSHEIDYVLPDLNRFSQRDIGFMS